MTPTAPSSPQSSHADHAVSWAYAPGRSLDLSPSAAPAILGILNTTPDSFSDGGLWLDPSRATAHALYLLDQGALGIDVGGESTRPGAARVDALEQIRRTVPVVAALRKAAGPEPIITIDTTIASVARAALDAGASTINDVSGATDDPDMLALCASRCCGIILMHRPVPSEQDTLSTRFGTAGAPLPPTSTDIIGEVAQSLASLAVAATRAGVDPTAIVLDPGLGFGKSVEQNLALIRMGDQLVQRIGPRPAPSHQSPQPWPILSGLSRKSFTCRAAGLPDDTPPALRVDASVALSLAHLAAGTRLFRVHDVAPHAKAFTHAGHPPAAPSLA